MAKSGNKWLGVAICDFMWLKVVLCRQFWMSEIHFRSHFWPPRQLCVYETLLFPYVSYPYFIKAMEAHIGQHISQATEMQTLCWSKTRPSFSSAHNSYTS